jgi:hypothetical protein
MSSVDGCESAPSCNRMQPGATPRNPVQPNIEADKTNPPRPAAPPAVVAARRGSPVTRAVLARASEFAAPELTSRIAAACNAVQPGATPRNAVQPISPSDKTNPPQPKEPMPSPSGLDARRRAAARLIALGRSIPQVADELRLCRTTVWRWQREPAFATEVDRVANGLVIAAGRQLRAAAK